jgi:hypothetical protein
MDKRTYARMICYVRVCALFGAHASAQARQYFRRFENVYARKHTNAFGRLENVCVRTHTNAFA